MARPKKEVTKYKTISLRVSAEEFEKLCYLSRRDGVTKSDVIRAGINERFKSRFIK